MTDHPDFEGFVLDGLRRIPRLRVPNRLPAVPAAGGPTSSGAPRSSSATSPGASGWPGSALPRRCAGPTPSRCPTTAPTTRRRCGTGSPRWRRRTSRSSATPRGVTSRGGLATRNLEGCLVALAASRASRSPCSSCSPGARARRRRAGTGRADVPPALRPSRRGAGRAQHRPDHLGRPDRRRAEVDAADPAAPRRRGGHLREHDRAAPRLLPRPGANPQRPVCPEQRRTDHSPPWGGHEGFDPTRRCRSGSRRPATRWASSASTCTATTRATGSSPGGTGGVPWWACFSTTARSSSTRTGSWCSSASRLPHGRGRPQSRELVAELGGGDKPFFLWSSFIAPHGTCQGDSEADVRTVARRRPARRDPRRLRLPSLDSPSFNERYVGDKPGRRTPRSRRAPSSGSSPSGSGTWPPWTRGSPGSCRS